MSHKALKRALAKFNDNQSQFAAAIGTSQQLVSYWLKNGKALPAELVLETERVTGISRHDLRADLYPREESAAA
jgi:DNA-binding transcriptional regulator YdaS (Cro superfamily)